jgi:1-acyl-sn-glycerol-3-phosphate acyltransferase
MKLLVKIISIPFLLLHYISFGLVLLFFDVLQRIAYHLFGYQTHKKTVDWMSFFLIKTLLFIGVRIKFHQKHQIPENVPLLIISNHQGLFDIPPIAWYFKKYHPKYVSKIELKKGAPGISYNLTHGGSVLIDRKDAKQSLTALANFGKYIEKNKYAAVIFPEGTRSKNGVPLPFKESGIKILVKYMPSAYIVPITINNAWKISKTDTFYKPFWTKVTIESHEPIAVNSLSFDELIVKTENCIKKAIIVS